MKSAVSNLLVQQWPPWGEVFCLDFIDIVNSFGGKSEDSLLKVILLDSYSSTALRSLCTHSCHSCLIMISDWKWLGLLVPVVVLWVTVTACCRPMCFGSYLLWWLCICSVSYVDGEEWQKVILVGLLGQAVGLEISQHLAQLSKPAHFTNLPIPPVNHGCYSDIRFM